MKNRNLSLLDKEQIAVRIFDDEQDAQRVILVGSDIAETIKEGLKDFKIEVVQQDKTTFPEYKIQTIEIPTIVKEIEIKEIEKQVIVTEYKFIEKPIIVKEIQIIEVEKAVVNTEIKTIKVPVLPKAFLWLFGIQVLISLITLLQK